MVLDSFVNVLLTDCIICSDSRSSDSYDSDDSEVYSDSTSDSESDSESDTHSDSSKQNGAKKHKRSAGRLPSRVPVDTGEGTLTSSLYFYV